MEVLFPRVSVAHAGIVAFLGVTKALSGLLTSSAFLRSAVCAVRDAPSILSPGIVVVLAGSCWPASSGTNLPKMGDPGGARRGPRSSFVGVSA